MRILFVIFFIAAIFFQDVAGECTGDQAKAFELCYIQHFKFLNIPESVAEIDFTIYKNAVERYPVEDYPLFQENIRDCLNDSTIIEDCANDEGFSKLSFVKGLQRNFTIEFWIMDYLSGEGFEGFNATHVCFQTFHAATNCSCNNDPETCEQYSNNIDCFANCTQEKCGDEAAQILRDTISIHGCYDAPICGTCLKKKNEETDGKA